MALDIEQSQLAGGARIGQRGITTKPPLLNLEQQAEQLRQSLWTPLLAQFGPALEDLEALYFVTHGNLHALPFELAWPEILQGCRCFRFPGILFLRSRQPAPQRDADTGASLLHANASLAQDSNVKSPGEKPAPIPMVLTDRAIANHLLPSPQVELRQAVRELNTVKQFTTACLSGHGVKSGAFLLDHDQQLPWQAWLNSDISLRHADVFACLLGRINEPQGDPLGWVAALLLKDTDTIVAALHPISDFYTPLLVLLYYQSRFTAKRSLPHPEDALQEAKRRLRTGAWYEADEVQGGEVESTATLVSRYYPIGMRETVQGILRHDLPLQQLAEWPLPSDRQQQLINRDTLRAELEQDDGAQLIHDTVSQLVARRSQLHKNPALRGLLTAMVCFGETRQNDSH